MFENINKSTILQALRGREKLYTYHIDRMGKVGHHLHSLTREFWGAGGSGTMEKCCECFS